MESSRESLEASFSFDLSIYRLEAIKKAAYRFAADFQVSVERVSEQRVSVRLVPKGKSDSGLDPHELPREVLDQELREVVADETKGVRDLLLAHTFSGLALTDPQGERGDYREDPLGIASQSHSGPGRIDVDR